MSRRRHLEDRVLEGGRGGYPDRISRGKTLQTDTRRSDLSSPHLIHSSVTSECIWFCPLVVRRVRLSTPATLAVTPCPVTPPAATATSAGSTEELEETEEAGVALATLPTLTPTFLTRGGLTTAASTLRPTTTTLATESCPTASPPSPCTSSLTTAASRSCPWEGTAVAERRGDGSLHLSYLPQPIRTKDTGLGHSHLLAPVLIKWMLLNPGKRTAHWWDKSFMESCY